MNDSRFDLKNWYKTRAYNIFQELYIICHFCANPNTKQ